MHKLKNAALNKFSEFFFLASLKLIYRVYGKMKNNKKSKLKTSLRFSLKKIKFEFITANASVFNDFLQLLLKDVSRNFLFLAITPIFI